MNKIFTHLTFLSLDYWSHVTALALKAGVAFWSLNSIHSRQANRSWRASVAFESWQTSISRQAFNKNSQSKTLLDEIIIFSNLLSLLVLANRPNQVILRGEENSVYKHFFQNLKFNNLALPSLLESRSMVQVGHVLHLIRDLLSSLGSRPVQ